MNKRANYIIEYFDKSEIKCEYMYVYAKSKKDALRILRKRAKRNLNMARIAPIAFIYKPIGYDLLTGEKA